MHFSEGLLAAFVCVFALRGFWLGLPVVLCRLTGLAAGYGAAIALTPVLAEQVERYTPLAGLTPYPVTAIAVFLLTALLVQALGKRLIRRTLQEPERQGRWPAALLNGSLGLALGLLAIWLVGLLQGALQPQRVPPASALQTQADHLVARVLTRVLAAGLPAGHDAPAATEQLLAQPTRSMADLHYLSRHAALHSLLRDPDNQRLLHQRDHQGLQQSPAFKSLVQDTRARTILQRTDFMAPNRDTAYPDALAEALIDLWSRVEAARHDPRLQAIVNEADYRQALQGHDFLRLVNDPRTVELARIVMQARPPALPAATADQPPAADTADPQPAVAEPAIYRWQDARGIWHFSDRQP